MPPPQTMVLFVGLTVTVLAVPGPSVVYAVGRSLEQGRLAGLAAVAGLETGLLVHVVAASAGVTGAVASSPDALAALRVAGAGVLAVLGVRQLAGTGGRAPGGRHVLTRPAHGTLRVFRDGVLVDVLNPKTVLFFLALLPPFVDPDRGPVAAQTMTLGLVVVALACLLDGAWALAAGTLRGRLGGPGSGRVVSRVSGSALLGLAFAALVT